MLPSIPWINPRGSDPSFAPKDATTVNRSLVDILTTVPQTGYDFVSGSSLAAAHVTGVVALLLEEDPALRPGEALDVLRATSRPLAVAAASTRSTAGLVDACAALGKLTGRGTCL